MKILLRIVALLVLLAPVPAQASSSRHLIFVSDLHVGVGKTAGRTWNRIEDFRWEADWRAFLDRMGSDTGDQADLILTGDVFELWQSSAMQCADDLDHAGCIVNDCNAADPEIGCSEPEALARLEAVLRQHPDFVAAVLAFSRRGGNRVIFIPGNHDAALTLPSVRDALLQAFSSGRVSVAGEGYWRSPDGAVYSDHGHQFDGPNKFRRWPQPYAFRDSVRYLERPWGENMVQRLFNQYEAIFPVMDNLTSDTDGIGYAMKDATGAQRRAVYGRVARFLVYEESLAQLGTFLGKTEQPAWNYAGVRVLPKEFFLEVLPSGDRPASGQAVLEPALLSDEEIDAVCGAKLAMPQVQPCPRSGSDLGSLVGKLVLSDSRRIANYLRSALPHAAGDGPLAQVYVYGHTHNAVRERSIEVRDSNLETRDITVVNTGAFQRVATLAQVEALLAVPGSPQPTRSSLVPEDLPACYNFVWIKPYQYQQPQARLYAWVKQQEAYTAQAGTCPGR
jgi:metallophosphoesterase superfamily enzyme